MMIPTCPLRVWRELYDKAIAFREIACWEWMSDSQVFGIQAVDSEEIGYCCVLGELGEVFGLVVYLGSEGLEIQRKIQTGKLRSTSPESRYSQKCLTVWFSNRGELDKTDLATAKKLGYNFKGRNVWPQFRSMRPGYYPWHLTESEAIFLTDCLDQARFVAIRLDEDPGWLDPPKKNYFLIRVPGIGQRRDSDDPIGADAKPRNFSRAVEQRQLFSGFAASSDLDWRSVWRKPTPVETRLPVFRLDEVRLQRIKNSCRNRGGNWEIDAFYSPSPVDGDDRPYFPYTYLCVDQHSGMILESVLAEPSKWTADFPQALLATIEKNKLLPSALWLRNRPLLELLKPLAQRLGVDVIAAKKLSSLDEAKQALRKFLAGER